MWYSQCFSTGRYFMKTCLLIVMIIVLDNCTQIRYYRECYMIEKQYKKQTLQSEKKKKLHIWLTASNGNSEKSVRPILLRNSWNNLCADLPIEVSPLLTILSTPGLSLSFHTFCFPFAHKLSFFPLVIFHSGSLHWSGVWLSLPFVPTESVYQHHNFSHTFNELGWLSPYPSPTITWGISVSIKPRTVTVFFIFHSHYSYIRWGTGWMNSMTLKISLLSSAVKRTHRTLPPSSPSNTRKCVGM